MELRHLEYFVTVADERSFTRAAARLHVVQSGVSAAIKALEAELGMPLLERDSKHVDLTTAGDAFLPKARATLDAARAARDAIDGVRGGLRGTLRLGTMISVGLINLPAVLGEFHALYPDVELHLNSTPGGSQQLVEAVNVGSLDLAFVSLPDPPPPAVELEVLGTAPVDLIVPLTHPFAGRKSISLGELSTETFVDFPPHYYVRRHVDRAFADAAVQRQVSLIVTDVPTAVECVAQGLGIGFVPRFDQHANAAIVRVRVTDAHIVWPLAAATSSSRRPSAAAHAFQTLVRASLNP